MYVKRYQALRALHIRVPGEPGNEAVKSRVDQAAYGTACTVVLVVTKAYAVRKALHLAVYFIAMLRNSLLAALVMVGWSCSCLSTVVSFM